jgi:hypothetical protein
MQQNKKIGTEKYKRAIFFYSLVCFSLFETILSIAFLNSTNGVTSSHPVSGVIYSITTRYNRAGACGSWW